VIPRADFIAAVLACEGTPVVHMGRVIGEGLDCGGLPWAAANACGAGLPPTRSYSRWPSAEELESALAAFCERTDDFANAHVWQVYVGKHARHLVVPIGDNLVMQAYGKNGVVQRTRMPENAHRWWRIRGVA